MTIDDALATTVATDAFDEAVEYLSDLCEKDRTDKEAAKALLILLQRNDDYAMRQLHS